MKAIQYGAEDYLVKDEITPTLLEKTIEHSAARFKLKMDLLKSQSQLRQIQKMEAIGTLAGGIAHDFNNILTIIIGHTELLDSDTNKTPRQHHSIDQITKASEQAKELTTQLLSYSGQKKIETTLLDVKPVLLEMTAMLERLVRGHTLNVNFHTDGMKHILFNKTEFQQIIMNLIINAKDALENNGLIEVDVNITNMTGHETIEDGEYLKLSVTDNGQGMDQETQDKIFDPFYSTKSFDKTKGTGLGLAIVKTIINERNSYITVDSTLGEGTCFNIYIPLANNGTQRRQLLEKQHFGSSIHSMIV